MLWRGTLKDFILRYSLQPPTYCRQSLLGQASAPALHLQISDKCSHQCHGPWCFSTGPFSWGSRGLAVEMPLGLEQPSW